MPRYRLTIAYDGTRFCGWQKQEPPAHAAVSPTKVLSTQAGQAPTARVRLRTVQEIVEQAVRRVVREPVEVIGASRTDGGVHARGQVAAFTCSGDDTPTPAEPASATETRVPACPDTPAGTRCGAADDHRTRRERSRTGWPVSRGPEMLRRALNSCLPSDVLIRAVQPAPPDFDPVGQCLAKCYSYTLHVSPDRPLWDRWFVHHVRTPLNLEAMAEAARILEGEHDFAAFAASRHGRPSTVRRVFSCRVREQSDPFAPPIAVPDLATGEPRNEAGGTRVRIEVVGNGFLYNMVRIMAGTLLEVGRGRMAPADVAAALASRDRRRAGPTLPPAGLCLEWIHYPGDPTGAESYLPVCPPR